MIIPIRCFTCGQVLASKYNKYRESIKKYKQPKIISYKKRNTKIYVKEMEKVGIKRYCCKRHFLGQMNILEKL